MCHGVWVSCGTHVLPYSIMRRRCSRANARSASPASCSAAQCGLARAAGSDPGTDMRGLAPGARVELRRGGVVGINSWQDAVSRRTPEELCDAARRRALRTLTPWWARRCGSRCAASHRCSVPGPAGCPATRVQSELACVSGAPFLLASWRALAWHERAHPEVGELGIEALLPCHGFARRPCSESREAGQHVGPRQCCISVSRAACRPTRTTHPIQLARACSAPWRLQVRVPFRLARTEVRPAVAHPRCCAQKPPRSDSVPQPCRCA